MLKRLSLPTILALGICLSAPPLGQIRDLLVESLGPAFGPTLGKIFLGLVGVLGSWAAWRALAGRRHRLLRVIFLLAAVGLVALVVKGFRTGQALVDAVERAHLVAYGALAYALLWAVRPGGLGNAIAAAVGGTALVAVVDEFVQWWVALRVGEVRDVGLNLASGACGLLIGFAHYPFGALPGAREMQHARKLVGGLMVMLALTTGSFLQAAHFGYWHEVEGGIGFRSRFSLAELERLANARAEIWKHQLPWSPSPWSREDHYLTEAKARVAHRNAAWKAEDLRSAAREQLLLERFFAPFLRLPAPESGGSFDWSAEQRTAVLAAIEAGGGVAGESPVFRNRLWTSSALRWGVWLGVGLLAVAGVAVGFRVGKTESRW